MSFPAPRYAEEETRPDDHGWPQPRPTRSPPPPSSRRRRDRGWLLLAGLGLLLGLAAVGWYLSLGRSRAPATLTVPRVVGLDEGTAVRRLTSLGFDVQAIERPGAAKPGHVFAQRPQPRTKLASGATVTIRVAHGGRATLSSP